MHILKIVNLYKFKASKIPIIKVLRTLYGLGLAEAKDMAESLSEGRPEIQIDLKFIGNQDAQTALEHELLSYGLVLLSSLVAQGGLLDKTKKLIVQAIDEKQYDFAIEMLQSLKNLKI